MVSMLVSGYRRIRDFFQATDRHDMTRELIGASLALQIRAQQEVACLADVEFRVYSQFGDDGIIQWLLGRIPDLPPRFIEFGVEDYTEATTRFLLVHDRWSGLVMDGALTNIRRLKNKKCFWRHDLTAIAVFLDRDNVDRLISEWARGRDIGILHIDVDGNDYWLWEAIHSIDPWIVIIEYNAIFGAERAITTPYSPDFRRLRAHYSGQYYGASLAALTHLANRRGYVLIGTNGAGNNAYFVKRQLIGGPLRELAVTDAYSPPQFRNSLDRKGRLNFLSLEHAAAAISGLPVVNVLTGSSEPL